LNSPVANRGIAGAQENRTGSQVSRANYVDSEKLGRQIQFANGNREKARGAARENSRRSSGPQGRTHSRKGTKTQTPPSHELPHGKRRMRKAEYGYGSASQFSVRERYNKQSQKENRQGE